jgi:hypothetical protein
MLNRCIFNVKPGNVSAGVVEPQLPDPQWRHCTRGAADTVWVNEHGAHSAKSLRKQRPRIHVSYEQHQNNSFVFPRFDVAFFK